MKQLDKVMTNLVTFVCYAMMGAVTVFVIALLVILVLALFNVMP